MKFTPETVRKVATLARLKLSDAEVERLAGELSAILEHVEQLNQLDTSGVEPTSHAVAMQSPERLDRPRTWLTREQALKNAPEQRDGLVAVPRIIGDAVE